MKGRALRRQLGAALAFALVGCAGPDDDVQSYQAATDLCAAREIRPGAPGSGACADAVRGATDRARAEQQRQNSLILLGAGAAMTRDAYRPPTPSPEVRITCQRRGSYTDCTSY